MDKELIKNALKNALYLICEESQSLENKALIEDYETVIEEIRIAIQELDNDEK